MTTGLKRTYMRSLKLAMFKRKKRQAASRLQRVRVAEPSCTEDVMDPGCRVDAVLAEDVDAVLVDEADVVLVEDVDIILAEEADAVLVEKPNPTLKTEQPSSHVTVRSNDVPMDVCNNVITNIPTTQDHGACSTDNRDSIDLGVGELRFQPNDTLVEIQTDTDRPICAVEAIPNDCASSPLPMDESVVKRARYSLELSAAVDVSASKDESLVSGATPDLSLHESASFVDIIPGQFNHTVEDLPDHECSKVGITFDHEGSKVDVTFDHEGTIIDVTSDQGDSKIDVASDHKNTIIDITSDHECTIIDLSDSPDSFESVGDLPIRSQSPPLDVIDQDHMGVLISESLSPADDLPPTVTSTALESKENTQNEPVATGLYKLPLVETAESLVRINTRINECSKLADARLKEIELKAMESQMALDSALKELEMQKVKANMLEESSDYLHRQNERLKTSNHHLTVAINTICAINSNLKRSVDDFAVLRNELQDAYTVVNDELEGRTVVFKECLSKVSDEVNLLGGTVSTLNILEIRNQVARCIGDAESRHITETQRLQTTNQELMQHQAELKAENSELRARNEQLAATNGELKEEMQLKETYLNDLEKSMDEMMTSDKFYQDQLITSDNLIKELKLSKQKACGDFTAELDEARRAFLKETGLLKLRIEELEDELVKLKGG